MHDTPHQSIVFCITLDTRLPLGFRLAYDGANGQLSNGKLHSTFGSVESLNFEERGLYNCGFTGLRRDQWSCGQQNHYPNWVSMENIPRVCCVEDWSGKSMGLRVMRVRTRSQAYKNGLRENDVILQILGYDGCMTYDDVMEYFRTLQDSLVTLVVKRGPENDQLSYPSFSCIDDTTADHGSSSPVPFGSPMATTTNVCCLHGVQTKSLFKSLPPLTNAPAITSSGENIDSKSNIFSNVGWFSPLKKFGQWLQFKQPEKQVVPPATTAGAIDTMGHLPNGDAQLSENKQQASTDEQSWVSKALKRYANIETMSKIPVFLSKSPAPVMDDDQASSNRPARILKVVTSSTPLPPPKLEQRPSSSVMPIVRIPEQKVGPPVAPKVPPVEQNVVAPVTKVPPPVMPKPKRRVAPMENEQEAEKSEWINTKILRTATIPKADLPGKEAVLNAPAADMVPAKIVPAEALQTTPAILDQSVNILAKLLESEHSMSDTPVPLKAVQLDETDQPGPVTLLQAAAKSERSVSEKFQPPAGQSVQTDHVAPLQFEPAKLEKPVVALIMQATPVKPSQPISAPPLSSNDRSFVQIRVKPMLAPAFIRRDTDEEEETDSVDSDDVMERKMRASTIISVPTVVQHHGATTVRMHVKRYDRSMTPIKPDFEEPEKFHDKVPTIIIEKAATPELADEEEEVVPSEEPIDTMPVLPEEQPPEQACISDDIWPLTFDPVATIMAETEPVPPPTMEEPQIMSPEELEDVSEVPQTLQDAQVILEPIPGTMQDGADLPQEPPQQLPPLRFQQHEQALQALQPQQSHQPQQPLQFQQPEQLQQPKHIPKPLQPQQPVQSQQPQQAQLHTVVTNLEEPSCEEEKKFTVSEIKRQWPPPSNATGVEIVKDVIERSDMDEEESAVNDETSKGTHFPRSHLFDEAVAEKVRACQSIVHELKASATAKEDTQSKAQRMFTKRKQRSAKYVVSSPGPEVCTDNEVRNNAKVPIDKAATQPTENGDQKKIAKKIRNPMGDVHDFQQMKKEYGDIVTNIASAEKCQEISQALKSHSAAGKGLDMFAKRRQEAEEWVVDEHPEKSGSQTSIGAMSLNFEFPSTSVQEKAQSSHAHSGRPPHPGPPDVLRPFKRELERIASPTPMMEWSSHDRHERIFSPVPWSTRTRAPSLERIAFSPSRPFSPSPAAFPESTRSSSILSDRFDPRDIAVKPSSTMEGASPAMAPIPPPRSSLRPQRMNSFNTLPRSWKSYSEAYQQKHVGSQQKLA